MAQRSGFDAVFLNDQGQPLTDLNIRVLDGNGNQVQVYETKTGTSLKPQPITTISANKGLVQFWADPGYYQVEVSDTQIPARIATRVVPFDAVAGDTTLGAEGISLSQVPTVTNSKIGEAAITESKIGDRQVGTLKIKQKAVDWGEINDNAIRANHILDGQVTGTKVDLTRYKATLGYNASPANLGWNDYLHLTMPAGIYFLMVSGSYSNNAEYTAQITMTDGYHFSTYGIDVARNSSFARQDITYTNGNVRFSIYPYGGKAGLAAGTQMTAIRIG